MQPAPLGIVSSVKSRAEYTVEPIFLLQVGDLKPAFHFEKQKKRKKKKYVEMSNAAKA